MAKLARQNSFHRLEVSPLQPLFPAPQRCLMIIKISNAYRVLLPTEGLFQ
jgi:hypothetical protein